MNNIEFIIVRFSKGTVYTSIFKSGESRDLSQLNGINDEIFEKTTPNIYKIIYSVLIRSYSVSNEFKISMFFAMSAMTLALVKPLA